MASGLACSCDYLDVLGGGNRTASCRPGEEDPSTTAWMATAAVAAGELPEVIGAGRSEAARYRRLNSAATLTWYASPPFDSTWFQYPR